MENPQDDLVKNPRVPLKEKIRNTAFCHSYPAFTARGPGAILRGFLIDPVRDSFSYETRRDQRSVQAVPATFKVELILEIDR